MKGVDGRTREGDGRNRFLHFHTHENEVGLLLCDDVLWSVVLLTERVACALETHSGSRIDKALETEREDDEKGR